MIENINLFNDIIYEIESFEDKDTEISPEQYSELFYKIMKFGNLEDYDILRFIKYFPDIFKNIIDKK